MFKLMQQKQFKKVKDGQKLMFQTENFTKQYHSDSTKTKEQYYNYTAFAPCLMHSFICLSSSLMMRSDLE